jgi:hypothetical protein
LNYKHRTNSWLLWQTTTMHNDNSKFKDFIKIESEQFNMNGFSNLLRNVTSLWCIISNIAINNYCRTEYLIWSFWILFVIYNVNILVHISHALSLNDITLFKVLFYISIIKKQEERRFFRVINIVLSCLRTNIWIPVLI